MGNLDKVSMIQEDYRDLLRKMLEVKSGGPTLEEETVHQATGSYPEDSIINLCVALTEVGYDDANKEEIIRDSIGILDHLDTLGMEIRFKNG